MSEFAKLLGNLERAFARNVASRETPTKTKRIFARDVEIGDLVEFPDLGEIRVKGITRYADTGNLVISDCSSAFWQVKANKMIQVRRAPWTY
jgi:hypothetical protein